MNAVVGSLLLLLPAAQSFPRAEGLRLAALARSIGPTCRRRGLHPSPSLMTSRDGCAFAAPRLPNLPIASHPGRRGSMASTSAMRATPAGKAGALFPSDDSDYEQAENGNGLGVGGTATLVDAATSSANTGVGNASSVRASEVFHPTQSRVQIGDTVITDPMDIVADWVSDWFVEQSLQKRASDGGLGEINEKESTNNDGEGTNDSSNYVMETYSPGSALDAIALASNTYTPLSYQIRTVVRVVLPSIILAAVATAVYPSLAQWLIHLPTSTTGENAADGSGLLYTDQVLTVLSNDLSQYVQNILTTCALLFGMLVGQTYYFMYQQQELVFYALFAEVTEAKSLLEQISLMSYGRPGLYPSLLSRMDDYVQNDLKVLSTRDPIATTSRLPRDDPLESILYATSVGLPGVVYETVKSLRQARADRCGALQRKLPALHIYLLRLLGVIVLTTFPVCGSGSQAIAPNVLVLQSYMFGILAFALTLVLNVVEELRNSRKRGAYNVDGILEVMVGGLERELEERLVGKFWGVGVSPGLPSRGMAVEGGVYDVVGSDSGNGTGLTSNAMLASDGVASDAGTDEPRHSRTSRVRKWLRRKMGKI